MIETSNLICRDYAVSSLNEYFSAINSIYSQQEKGSKVLWFRGHSYDHYKLLPSSMRGALPSTASYNKNTLCEEYRYQHFRSKTTHLIKTNPTSRVEWQELMQHHFVETRFMDWSESAVTALLFALEAYIDSSPDREKNYKKRTMTPVIWLLDPVKLNQHIFQRISNKNNFSLIIPALRDVRPPNLSDKKWHTFINKISSDLSNVNLFSSNNSIIDGIVCLAVIENERQANADRLYNLLLHNEFNPFFYLLLRYYGDGVPVDLGNLPPLAIVHPYHSSRIEAQKGVFTVFPSYISDKDRVDTLAMERQTLIQDCLYKIRITRPAKVARDLLQIGERRQNLYPEIETYAKELKVKSFSV